MSKEITSQEFEKQYKNLNEAQKKAVDTIEGPVMVIAGPGTGKTTILSLRIAQILLKTDTSPENILALTFTESGVYAMRRKLVNLLGNMGYRIKIHTFHSFCNEIIQDYPEYFPKIIGGTNLANTEQLQIIESILLEKKWEHLTPYGDQFYYTRSIIDAIRNLKREGISFEKYKKFLDEQNKILTKDDDSYNKKGELKSKIKEQLKKIEKSLELAEFYKRYQEVLSEIHKYDFEDMILEVVDTLEKDENLLLILQEEYQYLLADEHQDTNNAQNKILELLASFHESPNLFIVGDEKQAIFRFQGASLNNFLYFKDRYKDTTLITLDKNYRSTQKILDASHSMILNNQVDDQSLRQRLVSGKDQEGKNIKVIGFSNPDFEIKFLMKDLEEKISSGILPQDIAVLYRNNSDLFEILKYLEKSNIPFTVRSDRNLLQDPDIRKLIIMLRLSQNPLDNQALALFLLFPHIDFNVIDAHKIIQGAHRRDIPIIDVLSDENILNELNVKNIDRAKELTNLLNEWAKYSYQESAKNVLEKIFKTSGMLKNILTSQNSFERLISIDSIFNEIKKLDNANFEISTKEFLRHIDILEEYGILVSFVEKTSSNGVELMTAHKSKGLEFKYVYIVGATHKKWGGKSSRKYFVLPEVLSDKGESENADERRLFYVAITRAKEEVYILYSNNDSVGKPEMPSVFIDEIDQSLVEKIDSIDLEKDLDITPEYILEKIEVNSSVHDKEYLRQKFLDQNFSVTALNNYLSCPWKYFFTNLIRIPFAYSKHQQYGTAVHGAFKDFFNKYSTGEDVLKDFLIERFTYYLRQQKLDTKTHSELEEKGKKSLGGYFDFYKNTWPRQLLTEFNISGIDFKFDNDKKITLTGNLDKIDFNDNGSVSVIDFKTSKPKSRNELLGETESGTGDYFRQLTFYKFLLNQYDSGKYQMEKGIIDFVEPDEKSGKYKREEFEITDQEVGALIDILEKTAKEIYDFNFWDKKCESAECEFCALRQMMSD